MQNQNPNSSTNIEILTPSGFQPFDGIKRYWHNKSLKFTFDDNTTIECANDHRFIVDDKEVYARTVKIGDNIGKPVKKIIELSEGDYFYDPVNVRGGKIYNHDNGLISHNTFFGTGDTLINAETLMKLTAIQPIRILEGGDLLVYEESQKGHEYIICVDVSKGRGQDYSTFNVIDVTSNPFKQVAVYRCNTISPILFPDIIYKYGTSYNQAYVIIESNDQGVLVTQGLYHDLEYENVHVSSALKSNGIGVEMTRKTKRLGCSGIKDIIENDKLVINDTNTIVECSTFIAKGQSYEASDGNHDDLMMNLVMFGYFATTEMFGDMTDINLKEMMFKDKMQQIENDMVPFGFIDDGSDAINELQREEDLGKPWAIDYDHQHF